MVIDTGGSAFPLPLGSSTTAGAEGMTLRDHFAGLAMQGQITGIDGLELGNKKCMAEIGVACYEMADAMLAARSAG